MPPNRMESQMFRGLVGICFYADDLSAAREWYTTLLGLEPYFVRPHPSAERAYIEFRVGDDQDELGILDRRYGPPGAANPLGGAVTGWHVDDVRGAMETLLAMGATEYEPIDEQDGFVTASVIDPFGNVLGISHNPHSLEMHAARNKV
jgi:catechol 2,3-dioxygenase-like lactoylglutathione lyase family enzyme